MEMGRDGGSGGGTKAKSGTAAADDMEGWFPEIGSSAISAAKLAEHVSAFLSGVALGKAICTPPPDLR